MVPPKPPGLDYALWFDLSPMRPDEWAQTDAARWNEAAQMRSAYQAGVDQARRESEMDATLKAKAKGLAAC